MNKEIDSHRRVVVTGMGMVSPLGLDVPTSWNRLIAGDTGIVKIYNPWINVRVAGLVNNFNPKIASAGFATEKDINKMSLAAQYALAAAIEACREAGLYYEELFNGKAKLKDRINPNKAGVQIGTGLGGAYHLTDVDYKIKTGVRISPFATLRTLHGRIPAVVAMKLGLKGPLGMPSAECATGNYAIISGYKEIKEKADIMIVGGADSTVERASIEGFYAMGALSHASDPQKACRPFDKNRDGFVMGEGAGILVLEEKRHAEERGAKILAELVGYGDTSDAFHDTDPSGEGAERAMEEAIESMGGLPEKGLIYIHAHGTGTIKNEQIEIPVTKRVMFENHNYTNIAISSTKGATGHMMGATAAVGAIFSVLALTEGILPPTIHLEEPMDEAAGIDLVPNKAKKAEPVVVFNNSFGFGGFNKITVFKRLED